MGGDISLVLQDTAEIAVHVNVLGRLDICIRVLFLLVDGGGTIGLLDILYFGQRLTIAAFQWIG